jgi:hypothetical protein
MTLRREPTHAQVIKMMTEKEQQTYVLLINYFVMWNIPTYEREAQELFDTARARYDALPWYRRIFL